MNKVRTIYKGGMTAKPSNEACIDGDALVSLNVIPDNGELRPILQAAKYGGLPNGYNPLTIHEPTDGNRYIIISWGKTLKYYKWDKDTDLPTDDKDYTDIVTLDADETLTKVTPIGNTLAVTTSKRTFYILYKDKSYIVLGSRPPEINMQFGLTYKYLHSDKAELPYKNVPKGYYTGDTNGNLNIDTTANFTYHGNGDDFTKEEIISEVSNAVYATLEKFCAENGTNANRFCHPFFIRYALRLYDGSHILQSAPVLITPNTQILCPIVEFHAHEDAGSKYKEKILFRCLASFGRLYFTMLNQESVQTELKKWKDVVTGVDVFISEPIQTYKSDDKIDGWDTWDTFSHSKKLLSYGSMASDYYYGNKEFDTDDEDIKDDDYKAVAFTGDKGDKQNGWLDLYNEKIAKLKSLIATTTDEKKKKKYNTALEEWLDNGKAEYHTSDGQYSLYMRLPYKSTAVIRDEVIYSSVFYKIQTIDFTAIVGDDDGADKKDFTVPTYFKKMTLKSLTERETLTDDYDSHCDRTAGCTYVYNNRLFLGDIYRGLYKGYDTATLIPYESGISSKVETIVYVRKDGTEYRVKSDSDTFNYAWLHYFYYPDKDAYRAVIRRKSDGYLLATLKLTAHQTLNGAFWFSDFDSPIFTDTTDFSNDTEIYDNNKLIEKKNQIIYSNADNPFYYPLSGRNDISTGKILSIASSSKAISQGQFGQYPLYAFTDDGVWALNINSSGAVSSSQPATRDVLNNATTLLQIDGSIIFTTAQGLMEIGYGGNAASSQCLSTLLDELPLPTFANIHRLDEVMIKLGIYDKWYKIKLVRFSDYLQGAKLAFDYAKVRVYISNSAYNYTYVYSLASKAWAIIPYTFSNVLNVYPTSYMFDTDNSAYNLTNKVYDGVVDAMFISRPIKLGTSDAQLKRLFSLAHDTTVVPNKDTETHFQCALFGSADYKDWYYINSSQDRFIRMWGGAGYKSYIYFIRCTMRVTDAIVCTDAEFDILRDNKLR
jgi:hypothetical protein